MKRSKKPVGKEGSGGTAKVRRPGEVGVIVKDTPSGQSQGGNDRKQVLVFRPVRMVAANSFLRVRAFPAAGWQNFEFYCRLTAKARARGPRQCSERIALPT